MTTYSQFIARVDEYASKIEPRRVLVGLIALPFFVVGFVVGLVFRVVWLVGVYLWSAGAVGFTTARGLGKG